MVSWIDCKGTDQLNCIIIQNLMPLVYKYAFYSYSTSSYHSSSYTLVYSLKCTKPSNIYPNPLTHAAHALHNPHQASPPPPPLPLHHLHLTLTDNPRQHPLLLSQLSLPPFNITFPLWYTSHPGTFRQLKETNRKAPPIKTTRISVPGFSGTICISGSWLLAGEGCCLWGVLGDWG